MIIEYKTDGTFCLTEEKKEGYYFINYYIPKLENTYHSYVKANHPIEASDILINHYYAKEDKEIYIGLIVLQVSEVDKDIIPEDWEIIIKQE